MATICSHWQSCDGYNAQCLLSNGERMTFRWFKKPKDVQAAADLLEKAHLERLAVDEEAAIESEIADVEIDSDLMSPQQAAVRDALGEIVICLRSEKIREAIRAWPDLSEQQAKSVAPLFAVLVTHAGAFTKRFEG